MMDLNLVKIFLKKFGEIPEEIEREILNVVKECYEKISHSVEFLEILLFETASFMKSFYSQERKNAKVITEDFEDSFIAMHEAWKGIPRIAVCLESMAKMPKIVQIGALRHEVGHSILHGSIEYYIFPATKKLLDLSRKFNLSKEYLFNLIYLISIAVKDFEVTKLLLKNGYIEDQIAYSQYLMRPSENDLTAWQLSKANPAYIILCLAGRLKDLACLIALQPLLKTQGVIKNIMEGLFYLPHEILNKILRFVENLPQLMNGDTFQNFTIVIDSFIENFCISILEKINGETI
jgi:hypothetical protein